MTDDRTTILVRLREVTNASSDASGNPVKKLHTAEHGVLFTEPGASVGYAVENFLPRSSAERINGRPVTLTLAWNGRVVGIELPRIGLPEPVAAPALSDAAVEAFKAAWHLADAEGRTGERVRDGLAAALPHLGAAPSATREDVETITIPRPHVPHGPAGVSRDTADADYLRDAARDLEGFYKPFGSNLRATVVGLLRDAADAITPRTDR